MRGLHFDCLSRSFWSWWYYGIISTTLKTCKTIWVPECLWVPKHQNLLDFHPSSSAHSLHRCPARWGICPDMQSASPEKAEAFASRWILSIPKHTETIYHPFQPQATWENQMKGLMCLALFSRRASNKPCLHFWWFPASITQLQDDRLTESLQATLVRTCLKAGESVEGDIQKGRSHRE